MSEVVSVRLSKSTVDRLRAHAAETSEPVSRLAQRLIDEGLRMAAHPGVVFRNGPAGRRAALLRGPDVWEVIGLLRSLEARGEAAVEEAAAWLGTPVAAIRQALAYYGAFPDEIAAEIAANEQAADVAQASWLHQQHVLAD
jgi:hypothetical protein